MCPSISELGRPMQPRQKHLLARTHAPKHEEKGELVAEPVKRRRPFSCPSFFAYGDKETRRRWLVVPPSSSGRAGGGAATDIGRAGDFARAFQAERRAFL